MTSTSPDYWRIQARRYDRFTLLLNANFIAMARAVAAAVQGADEVLEIAAGTGLVTQEVVQTVGHLTATDRSAAMLGVLRERASAHANLTIQEADAMALPFPDGSFDAVLICNLLHLLPEPDAALQEARRVLRPSGILVAPTFCHGQGRVAPVVSRLLGLTGFPIQTRFQDADLDRLVERAGFHVQEARWFPGLLPVRFVVAHAD